MTFNQFDDITNKMLEKVLEMRNTKGKEYAGSNADRFKNFKDIAEECGLDPIQVWHCYYKKHIRAIDSYVRTGQVFSEPIEGRFIDAITYLLLGYGLIAEVTNVFCQCCNSFTCTCPPPTMFAGFVCAICGNELCTCKQLKK